MLLSSQSDERLVSLARAGHERAFVAIVERYGPELQALARRLSPDGRGEDVLQQAFLSAFVALRSGGEVKHLRGWLYQIVRNTANRSRVPVCVPLDGEATSAEAVEDVVQQRALATSALAELARLPDRQRQAMVDTALGGKGRAEVASAMGLSEGAVRQLVHRARRTLRSVVTAVTPWPFARWFAAAAPSAPGSGELAAGAGAATSGAVGAKLGALLASGTLLSGVAAVGLHVGHPRRAAARPTASAHASVGGHRAGGVVRVAAPTRSASGSRLEAISMVRPIGARAGTVSAQRMAAHSGSTGESWRRRHQDDGERASRQGDRVGTSDSARPQREHRDSPSSGRPLGGGDGGGEAAKTQPAAIASASDGNQADYTHSGDFRFAPGSSAPSDGSTSRVDSRGDTSGIPGY